MINKNAMRKKNNEWKRAMQIARREYPKAPLKRRRRIASAITRKKK